MNTFNTTTLCSHCEEFRNLDAWSSEARSLHHASITALCESAKAGCHLCDAFVKHGLFSAKLEERVAGQASVVGEASSGGSGGGGGGDGLNVEEGGPLIGKSRRRHWYLTQVAKGRQRARYVSILEKFTGYDDALAPLILGRPIAQESSSEACLEVLREWYGKCRMEHYVCGPEDELPLPTRVVDVGSSTRDPYLLVTGGKKGQWATLSHCWGGKSPITTTLATLEDRRTGIRMADLPLTFVDAITLTRKLSLQYLWIDSLCIIQDSHEDWLSESAKMGEVYRGGFLNIAATGASHAGEGLFKGGSRDRHLAKPILSLPCFSTSLQAEGTIFLRALTSHDLLDQPLHRRGWVLQESMLSSQRVDFAPSQMHWNCRRFTLSEAFPTEHADQISDPLMAGAKELYHMPVTKYKPNPDIVEFAPISPMRWWYTALNSYVQRGITNHEDLLPAIAGVASKVARVTSYHYKAGLWEEDTLRGLLWQCAAPVSRPANTTVPSWSWASTDIPWVDKPRFGIELDYYLKGFRASVLGVNVENEAGGEFGHVLSSRLRLETRCRSLNHFQPSGVEENGLLTLWREDTSDTSESSAAKLTRCTLDSLPPNGANCITDLLRRNLICAQVCYFGEFRPDALYKGESTGSMFCLLLEQVEDDEGVYRRIGLAQIPEGGAEEAQQGWALRAVEIV